MIKFFYQADEIILGQLKQFNYDLDAVRKCIENNRHNHLTTTYYLLLQKIKNNEK